MKIFIVIDNPNNWFFDRAAGLIEKVKKMGHESRLLTKAAQIPDKTDIVFFLGCEEYISGKIREKSRYNIVIHASDLPKGRGMSPTSWQILEGKKKIPVTLFEVADGFDTGDYYIKDSFELDGSELIDEWQDKLYACIEKMALNFVKNIRKMEPKKQKGKASSYPRRKPEDSEIDPNKNLKEQFNLLRIVDNERYPAFFKLKGGKYILKIYKDKK